jgi:hypothetical protein
MDNTELTAIIQKVLSLIDTETADGIIRQMSTIHSSRQRIE